MRSLETNKSKLTKLLNISHLDRINEKRGLHQDERGEKRNLFAKLRQINFCQEALAKQKARYKWLEVGYMNTKYFHRVIKWKRMKDTIKELHI